MFGGGMASLSRCNKILLASLPCIIVLSVAVLCVLLLPIDSSSPPTTKFSFDTDVDGTVTWTDLRTGEVKLTVESETRSQECSGCTACENHIRLVDEKSTSDVQCFEIQSAKTDYADCDDVNDLDVQDCVVLQRPGAVETFWYGGAELYLQQWPINYANKEYFDVYLSTDLPWRYGNVLERYWISSSGAAIFVFPEVPLYVSHIASEKICLRANYNATVHLGQGYTNVNNETKQGTVLRYAVCLGDDPMTTHQVMLKSNSNPPMGFIDRPVDLPDARMLKDPIWSTWARYKARINQTTVEEYADEINARNFSNSQLEIDDGYETNYGDFTFDTEKFPDAIEMVKSLHYKGFRVTTWVTPFINTGSKNYLTGRRNGYFIRKSENDNAPRPILWWNGIGAAIDFTNEEAAAWYESLLQNVKGIYSIDSFKFDAGETNYLPRNGYTHRTFVNPGEYTSLYANSAFKLGETMMEMRSAWRTQSYPFYTRMMDKGSRWGGFKGLRTLIPTALTFGIIGYPYVLPDMVGGNAYGGLKPDRELYIRWLQINAFMPVIQFSITPWDYDEEVSEIARYYVNLHRTIVYEEILRVAENYVTGTNITLLTSPVWYLAGLDESDAFSIGDEFLVGDRYLVAPIVWEGTTKRDVYLPRGRGETPIRWRDMLRQDNEMILDGGQWLFDYRVELHEISWWERL